MKNKCVQINVEITMGNNDYLPGSLVVFSIQLGKVFEKFWGIVFFFFGGGGVLGF
jgi:hypothetical protein